MSQEGKTTYVLNKPSLLQSKESLLRYPNSEIVIPMAVLEDIQNSIETLDFAKKSIAKQLLAYIESQDATKISSEGIRQKNGSVLKLALNYKKIDIKVEGISAKDNRVLQTCIGLITEESRDVILISNNPVLRIKAKILGIKAEEQKDSLFPKLKDQYTGKAEVWASQDKLNLLYQNKKLDVEDIFDYKNIEWVTNLYLVIKTSEGASAIGYYNGKDIVGISSGYSPYGIKPKNVSQTFLMHALLDVDTPLVIVKGEAGTGKTICALAAGLEQTTNRRSNDNILYNQVLISTADDYNKDRYGFLPGELTEKIDPYIQGIYDNLDVIIRSKECEKDGLKLKETGKYLFDEGKIKVQALRCIRGRSISKTFYIFDETQNIAPEFMRTIITRAGLNSKFVFLGDPTQIDSPDLDERYNGLVYLSELMKGQSICRQISFTEGDDVIRSELSRLAVKLM